MATFAKYYPLLIVNEGGYVFDPHDPGGETWRGIARVYHPHWAGWSIISACQAKPTWPANCRVAPRNKLASALLKKEASLESLVLAFYQTEFWDSLNLSDLNNQSIASQLCDMGVNSGVGRVTRLAQYVLASSFGWQGVLTGAMDTPTLKAINDTPAQAYYNALVAARRSFYLYRAGHLQGIKPTYVSLLKKLKLTPDIAMQRYLPSWLGRINAIPFKA